MKLKLSSLVAIANLVTIDDCEVCGLGLVNKPGTVWFELADETVITLLDSEVEFTDETSTFELATDDNMTVTCKFFMSKSMKMADIKDFMSIHGDEEGLEDLKAQLQTKGY